MSRTWIATARREVPAIAPSSSPPATGWCATSCCVTFAGEGAKLDISGCFLGATARAHRHHAGGRPRRARLREPRAVQGRAGRQGARRVPGQGDRAARRAEDRRQADGAGADAVGGRRVRFQAGAGDPRRRRGLRSRLDRGRDSIRDMLFYLRARGIPLGGSTRAADRELRRRGARQDRGRAAARGAVGDRQGQAWPASPRETMRARGPRGGQE